MRKATDDLFILALMIVTVFALIVSTSDTPLSHVIGGMLTESSDTLTGAAVSISGEGSTLDLSLIILIIVAVLIFLGLRGFRRSKRKKFSFLTSPKPKEMEISTPLKKWRSKGELPLSGELARINHELTKLRHHEEIPKKKRLRLLHKKERSSKEKRLEEELKKVNLKIHGYKK